MYFECVKTDNKIMELKEAHIVVEILQYVLFCCK